MDRSLVAFAFLAQVSVEQTDLVSGLAPLFKPIAKAHVGRRFDPIGFADEVRKLYGLKMNPWAVEDFAPRLERAGVLQKVELPGDTYYYVYAPVQEEFASISEADVESLGVRFRTFARPILAAHKIVLSDSELSRMLREQLVDLDFIAILLKPEQQRHERQEGRKPLGLKKTEPETTSPETIEQEARQDVLCAAFILHVYRNEPEVYKLLVRIASGALLSEVILEFQEPKYTGRLDSLTVFLDAPFAMSLLDLRGEETHEFAFAVCEELLAHGVTLATFRHCVDELVDNLKAAKSSYATGRAKGATGRRLANPVFAAQCNAVIGNPEGRLKALKVRVLEGEELASRYQYFTEQDELSLYGALGEYRNELARKRDAASVAAVMRYRRGGRARMAEFGNAGYVFVTENSRVANAARRYCFKQNLLETTEVPPAITDRYLAGLLWVLFGGKSGDLTPTLLLANCAAALEPRNDVIERMYRFLSNISAKQADTFRALMTDERAGQHLMELTLGDPGFLSQENVEPILERLKGTLVEQEKTLAEQRLTQLRSVHEQQLAKERELNERRLTEAESAKESAKRSLLDVQTQKLLIESEARDLKTSFEVANDRAEEERRRRLQERQQVVQSLLQQLLRRQRMWYRGLAIAAASVVATCTYVGFVWPERVGVRLGVTLGAGSIAGLGFWKIPDFLFEPFLRRRLETQLDKQLQQLNLTGVREELDIDMTSGAVHLRNP